MPVKIRLQRHGRKGYAYYHIVIADSRAPRDGKFIEILGNYNPTSEPFAFDVKEDRVYEWMKNGAVPSESVMKLFKSVGLLERYDRFKKGETLATLVDEATKAYADRAAKIKA